MRMGTRKYSDGHKARASDSPNSGVDGRQQRPRTGEVEAACRFQIRAALNENAQVVDWLRKQALQHSRIETASIMCFIR